MTTATLANLEVVSLPQEMRAIVGIKPGVYSIHYFGEMDGTVQDWDGRSASDLLDEDIEDAQEAMGEEITAAMEVRVLLVSADECYLLDSAEA